MNNSIKQKLSLMAAEDGEVKLITTQRFKEFEDKELREYIKDMYYNKNLYINKLGTLVNSIFYHHYGVFMITKLSMSDLIKNDLNVKAKSINTLTYRKFMRKMFKYGWIKALREPVRYEGGLYELADKQLVRMLNEQLGREFLKAQREAAINLFDEQARKKIEEIESNKDVKYTKLLEEVRFRRKNREKRKMEVHLNG